jgi:hypothetical protein
MKFPKISSFNEIINLVNKNTIVVLDIDDTILTISGALEKAKHTDKNGLFRLLDKVEKCQTALIFLTARSHEMEEYTLLDLEELGIPSHLNVYYCGLINKGEYLKLILDLNPFFKNYNIIFVDDYEINLINVKNKFKKKVKCFQFIKNYERN